MVFWVEERHASSSQIRRSWNPAPCDDSRNGRQADLSGYPGPERLRHPHPHPGLAFSGGPCSWILSREYGIVMAEIARQLGVCASAIAKAIRKRRGRIKSVIFPLCPPIHWSSSRKVSVPYCPGSYRDEPTISRAELSSAGILNPRGAPRYWGIPLS